MTKTNAGKAINDGNADFPFPDCIYPNGQVQPGHGGMSLRDYFAAKAMASLLPALALLEDQVEAIMKEKGIDPATETEAFVSMMAYGFADAMLAERAKKESA